MTPDRYFLGIDGGQSSTTALIADASGQILGQGSAGPCNHAAASEGRAKLVSAIEGSVAQACAAARLDARAICFEAACLGLSGGPDDKEAIVRTLLRAERILVTNDAWVALSGAAAGGSGIVVIAGTGSIALGRNGSQTARAGGWGYVFGDEGGGFDIARRALRAALAMEEGWGPATALREILLEEFRAQNANELLHRFYTPEFPRPRIAQAARLVDGAAIANDSVAQAILEAAAKELAALALAVRAKVFPLEDEARIFYIGGAFRSAILFRRFLSALERTGRNRCLKPIYGPAAGALLEAYSLAQLRVSLRGVPEEKA